MVHTKRIFPHTLSLSSWRFKENWWKIWVLDSRWSEHRNLNRQPSKTARHILQESNYFIWPFALSLCPWISTKDWTDSWGSPPLPLSLLDLFYLLPNRFLFLTTIFSLFFQRANQMLQRRYVDFFCNFISRQSWFLSKSRINKINLASYMR